MVEREREINAFKSTSNFKVSGLFDCNGTIVKAELQDKFNSRDEAFAFLEKCKGAQFTIENLEVNRQLRKIFAFNNLIERVNGCFD